MEGVMLRNRNEMVVACRRSQGDISIHREEISTLARRFPFLRWPLLRGIVAFVEALSVGIKALNISTATVLEEEGEEMHPIHMALTMVVALAMAVGLFFLLPTFLANFLPPLHPFYANLVEGLFRILIFVSYILLISRWGDIKRFFAYHGAEHKAIYCFEAGHDLTVENAHGFSIRHPRCGTSFLLIVMMVSILLFTFFGWPGLWQRFLIRIVLLPVVAAFSYELIRITSQTNFKPVKLLALPGLWLQHLTTREPDHTQMEVALEALRQLEKEPAAEAENEEESLTEPETELEPEMS